MSNLKSISMLLLFALMFFVNNNANAQEPKKVKKIHRKHFDKREDIRDKREDKRDVREDVRDAREDVRDAKHDGGLRDKREDVRDAREDVRDTREDVRDKTVKTKEIEENKPKARHNLCRAFSLFMCYK